MQAKVLAVFASLLLFTGLTAAGSHGDNGQPDSPVDQPGDIPENVPSPEIPGLPDNASEVAQTVTDAINGAVGNVGDAVQNALQGLVGGSSNQSGQQ